MKVVTYITHEAEGWKNLKKSFPDLITLKGDPHYNSGILDKVWATNEYIKTLDDDEVVMFVDGFDVLIMDTKLTERYFDHYDTIMFNAEKACFPSTELTDLYEKPPLEMGNWTYLNSGVYAGKVKFLKKFLKLMITIFGKLPSADDQSCASVLYLASTLNLRLDKQCFFFQCYSFVAINDFIYAPGEIVNNITGTIPEVFHGNGKTDMELVRRCVETSFDWLSRNWVDTVAFHKRNKENFDWFLTEETNNEVLKEVARHRQFTEDYVRGFGDKSFQPMWYMLFKHFRPKKVIELGVFRGQIVSLWQLLSQKFGVETEIVGAGLFEKGGNIPDWDFSEEDTWDFYREFFLKKENTKLIKCDTTKPETVELLRDEYDWYYEDASHEYADVLFSLRNYAPMVKVGGLLIMDDSATDTQVPNGYFGGISTVTSALNDYLKETDIWEFKFSLVHIKVFLRVK